MDVESKNLHFRRGQIFQDMALVEQAMNRLISLYFVNSVSDPAFTKELLQNSYFSFELRKRVFQSVFKRRYQNLAFPWESLQKMQELRNIVAHARMEDEIQLPRSEPVVYLRKSFYSYGDVERDVVQLHNEFQEHMDKVVEALNQIGKDLMMHFDPLQKITVS